jgi:MFS family permease
MIHKENKLTLMFLLALSFLIQMIAGIVGISVPLYAKYLGATPSLLGIIGAVGGLVYTFMPFFFGLFLGGSRRKILISASELLYGLSCAFYAAAKDPLILIPVKALEWCSIALFWPQVEASLAEVGGDKIDETLKKFNLSWGSASIIGPMIGGLLVNALGAELSISFLSLSIILFMFSIASMVAIKEETEKMKGAHGEEKREKDSDGGSVVAAVIVILLFSFIGGIIFNLFPAYAVDLGISASEVGLMMLFNGLFRLVAFLEAYRVESRIGEENTFLSGSLMLASSSILAATSYTTPLLSISLSIMGFGSGILYAASISTMLKNWSHSRSYSAGIFESLIGLGYFLGSLIGGLAAEYVSNAPYFLGFLISLATIPALIFQHRTEKNSKQ